MLNEAEPFNCVRCAKPFGTRQMIDNMLGKLGGHSMFASREALRRLQMCARLPRGRHDGEQRTKRRSSTSRRRGEA